MFSPDGTLISASAAPHCGGAAREAVEKFQYQTIKLSNYLPAQLLPPHPPQTQKSHQKSRAGGCGFLFQVGDVSVFRTGTPPGEEGGRLKTRLKRHVANVSTAKGVPLPSPGKTFLSADLVPRGRFHLLKRSPGDLLKGGGDDFGYYTCVPLAVQVAGRNAVQGTSLLSHAREWLCAVVLVVCHFLLFRLDDYVVSAGDILLNIQIVGHLQRWS